MFTVLYFDDSLLVVDKATGVSVLPDGWDPEAPYLVKMLQQQYGRIWVVHRLDKVTSGVIVFARTAEAHRFLNMQLEKRETDKVYHAITVGVPPWEEKTTRFPLRANVGHSHRTMVDDRRGKPSETTFKTLKRGPGNALLQARPLTGRTHQIRVHAYALGYPLLGDTLYSAPETPLIARPALHAYTFSFTHPVSGDRLTFTAPYPADFEAALRSLQME